MPDDSEIENKEIYPHYFFEPDWRGIRTTLDKPEMVVLPGFENIPLHYKRECSYLYDYRKVYHKIVHEGVDRDEMYRKLIENDLFFIVYFILRIKKANHRFVVDRCNDIQLGPETDVVDLWARDHFKTTILSTAKPIQKILKNPEERICIFSFKREAALKIYLPIKEEFEKNSMLHTLYPHILCRNTNDYQMWTRDHGLKVLRKGSFREPTLMWSALQEGMPTGSHFTGKIFDDIMTEDMVSSFSEMEDVKKKFDMAQNLTDNDTGHDSMEWQVVAGTPYHPLDIFKHLADLKNVDGTAAYRFRKFPATDNGEEDGKPVLLTQAAFDKHRRNKSTCKTQMLLKPEADGSKKLSGDWLVEYKPDQIPKQLYKFILVDPAGDEENMKHRGKGDKWAVTLLGVEPVIDDIGQSNVFILDIFLRRATMAEAVAAVCRMYLLAGRIAKLGVEKVGTSTYEVHISNALRKFGVIITKENERLVILRPGMRNKQERIFSAMEWPMSNGKWGYVNTCPASDIKELKNQFDAFPLGKDDGPDICSYLPDITKDYKFPKSELSLTSGFTKPNDMWLDDDEAGDIDPRVMRAWLVR